MNYIMCLVDNDRIFQVDQLGRKEMYADYYDPAFANPRTYIKLAKSFLNDKDAPKDKVRRYINAMKA